MKVARFKLKNINDILQWIRTETQMVQWAGSVFTWLMTYKQFRTHLSAASSELPTLYPFGLYDRAKIIGYAELSNHLHNYNSAMLSRVLISPRRRKRGLGQFMVKQLIDFGFTELGLNRIGLGVFDFNKAAIKCYTQAGFVLEGTLRESAKAGDSYWNCHLMGILRKDWQPQQMTPAKIMKGC
jgi:RimJ/RimL family protein N-acetyltransferase